MRTGDPCQPPLPQCPGSFPSSDATDDRPGTSSKPPDGTRIDFACGLNVIAGRLETEDDAPGQLMVHVNKIVVSVNDGEVYDDRGRGNVADPIDAVVSVVDTPEGPLVFVDSEQARIYAESRDLAWWSGCGVLGRHDGAVVVDDSTADEQAAA